MKKGIALLLTIGLMATSLAGCGAAESSRTTAQTTGSAATENMATGGASTQEQATWPSTTSVELYVPFKAGGNSELSATIRLKMQIRTAAC